MYNKINELLLDNILEFRKEKEVNLFKKRLMQLYNEYNLFDFQFFGSQGKKQKQVELYNFSIIKGKIY